MIPARLGSARLPRKPLAPLAGRPLVAWVHEAVSRARGIDEVVVATDAEEVAEAVRAFGGAVEITRADHPSGTDRVAEVARRRPEAEVVVNVQGDEPLLPPAYLEAGLAAFRASPPPRMATLAARRRGPEGLRDPGVAKVVADRWGNALYFSRSPIPHGAAAGAGPGAAARGGTTWLRHVGVYFFSREALLEFVGLPPSPLERAEGLEQLRAIENGIPIRLVEVPEPTEHVDTPEDLARVEAILARR